MKEQKQFKAFVGNWAHLYPFRLSERELSDDFAQLVPIIRKAGFLKRIDNGSCVVCPGADEACLRAPFLGPKDRFYVNCECNESESLFRVNVSDFLRYEFDGLSFFIWLAGECGLERDIAEVESGFAWQLGSVGKSDKPTAFYCVRSTDVDKVSEFTGRLSDQKAVIFWFGEKPAVGHYPENILSLRDLVSVSGKALTVNKTLLKPFLDEKFFAKSGDIELDKHIRLHQDGGKYYLLLNKKGNSFEKKVSIRPQTYKIINAVYGARRKDPCGLTLFEFCHPRKIAQNDRTISTRINELNKLYKTQNIKEILAKFPADRWGLNRSLGCCK